MDLGHQGRESGCATLGCIVTTESPWLWLTVSRASCPPSLSLGLDSPFCALSFTWTPLRLPSVTPGDSDVRLCCSATWAVPHTVLRQRIGRDRQGFLPRQHVRPHTCGLVGVCISSPHLDGGAPLHSLVGSCHREPKATSFARKRQHHTGTDLSVRQLGRDSCPLLIGQSKSCDLPVGMGRWPHTGRNGNIRVFLPHPYRQISFTEIKTV